MIKATEANINDLLATGVVVLKFSADWCMPCKALSTVMAGVEQKFKDKVKFIECNVDDCVEVSNRFNVRTIPTVYVFKDGEMLPNKFYGVVAPGDLERVLSLNVE